MILLDAFAIIALLRGEHAADEVQRLLESDPDATLTALGVGDVLDHMVRVMGINDEEAALDLAQLGLERVPALSVDVALRAGLLRSHRYHRVRCAVSLADCAAAEEARRLLCPLATSDPRLLDVCHVEGIATISLPDSNGVRWSASP
jgi:PIN domain nuclease of toxin-antitoxin system